MCAASGAKQLQKLTNAVLFPVNAVNQSPLRKSLRWENAF